MEGVFDSVTSQIQIKLVERKPLRPLKAQNHSKPGNPFAATPQ